MRNEMLCEMLVVLLLAGVGAVAGYNSGALGTPRLRSLGGLQATRGGGAGLAAPPTDIFIFGLGYTGLAVARAAREEWGEACRIAGTCRTQLKADALKRAGIEAFFFDIDGAYEPMSGHALETLHRSSHVLSTMPPIADFNRDPVLEFHRQDLTSNCAGLKWAGYLSTTSVYGDHQGDWVTEESETRVAAPDPSVFRLQAEEEWLALTREGVPSHVFRLAGIYGPGRSALDTVRRESALRGAGGYLPARLGLEDKEQRGRRSTTVSSSTGNTVGKYISRVHVADIARIVLRSMQLPSRNGRIYNVADHEPSPRGQVQDFARELLGVGSSASSPLDSATAAATGDVPRTSVRMRRTDNKRVSNLRVLRELGIELRYPTFREGLRQIRDQEEEGL